MKLIRFGSIGNELPGVEIEGVRYDVSHLVPDYDEKFFATGGLDFLRKALEKEQGQLPRVAENIRLGSPLARPSKIVCIGLNYADHARETGAEPPKEPVVFLKSTTAI